MSSTDFDFNSEPLRAKPTVAVLKNQGLSNVLKTTTRHATKCLVRHAKFLFDSDIDMPPSSHPNHIACCAAEAKTCLDNLGSVICYTAWLLCAKERVSIDHHSSALVIRDAFLSELSLCDDTLPKMNSKTKKKMFITKLKLRFLLSLLEEFAFPLQDMVASLIELEVELDSFDEEVAKQESDDVPEVVNVDCGSANQLVRKSSVSILVHRQNELVEAYELEHKDSSLFWVEYVSDGKREAVCGDRIFRGRKRKPRPITQDDTHAARKKTQLSSGFPKSASMTTPVPSAAAAGQSMYRSLPTQRDASKSLGVLCQSFLELYKDAPPNRDNNGAVINVVEVAHHLGVKRRRIYGIISILESIDIVARVLKHTYRWHGTRDLPKFFAKLQRDAIEEQTKTADPNKPKTNVVRTTCHKLLQIFLSTGQFDFTLAHAADIITGPAAQAAEEAAQAVAPNPIPTNQLAPLPQPVGVSPLEARHNPGNDAATTTDGRTTVQTAMNTKVSRRMYDIVSVLQALGVLTKYNVGSTNKISLKWTFYLKPDEIAQYGASSQPPMQRNPNNPVAIANSRLTLDNDSESSPSRLDNQNSRTESSKTAPLGCERTPTPSPRTPRAFNGNESFDPMPSNKNFSSDGGRKYSMRGDQMPFPPAGSPPQMPCTPNHSRTTGTELRSVHEKSSQKDGVEDERSETYKKPTFPAILYAILSNEEYSHIISWMKYVLQPSFLSQPHGCAFKVYDKRLLVEEVTPKYFNQSKYVSFTGQLYDWGFQQLKKGPDFGCYYHEYFIRGRPYSLITRMRKEKRRQPVCVVKPQPLNTSLSKTAPLGCERPPSPTPRTRRALFRDESFDPNGLSWKVVDKRLLVEEAMPKYFGRSKYATFTEGKYATFTDRLKRWGFKMLKGCYYHEHFIRGQPSLVIRMRRKKEKKRQPTCDRTETINSLTTPTGRENSQTSNIDISRQADSRRSNSSST
eukprot:scaffold2581_cov84-Skeletonema_dohrnii-CCMP3373.AAC.8